MNFTPKDSLSTIVALCGNSAAKTKEVLTNLEVIDPYFDSIVAVKQLRDAVAGHYRRSGTTGGAEEWDSLAAECLQIVERYGDVEGESTDAQRIDTFTNVLSFDDPASSNVSALFSGEPMPTDPSHMGKRGIVRAASHSVMSFLAAARNHGSDSDGSSSAARTEGAAAVDPQSDALDLLGNSSGGLRYYSAAAENTDEFLEAVDALLRHDPELLVQTPEWQLLAREVAYCACAAPQESGVSVVQRYYALVGGKERCWILYNVLHCLSGDSARLGQQPEWVSAVLSMLAQLPSEWITLTDEEISQLLRNVLVRFTTPALDTCTRVDPMASWLQKWISSRFALVRILSQELPDFLLDTVSAWPTSSLHAVSITALVFPFAATAAAAPTDDGGASEMNAARLDLCGRRLVYFLLLADVALEERTDEIAHSREPVARLVVRSLQQAIEVRPTSEFAAWCVGQLIAELAGSEASRLPLPQRHAVELLTALARSDSMTFSTTQLESLDKALFRLCSVENDDVDGLVTALLRNRNWQGLRLVAETMRSLSSPFTPRTVPCLLCISMHAEGWEEVRRALFRSAKEEDTRPSSLDKTVKKLLFRVFTTLMDDEKEERFPAWLLSRWCTCEVVRRFFEVLCMKALRRGLQKLGLEQQEEKPESGSDSAKGSAAALLTRARPRLLAPPEVFHSTNQLLFAEAGKSDIEAAREVEKYQRCLLWLQVSSTKYSAVCAHADSMVRHLETFFAGRAASQFGEESALLLLQMAVVCAHTAHRDAPIDASGSAPLVSACQELRSMLAERRGSDPLSMLLHHLLELSSSGKENHDEGLSLRQLFRLVWNGYWCGEESDSSGGSDELKWDAHRAKKLADVMRSGGAEARPRMVEASAAAARVVLGEVSDPQISTLVEVLSWSPKYSNTEGDASGSSLLESDLRRRPVEEWTQMCCMQDRAARVAARLEHSAAYKSFTSCGVDVVSFSIIAITFWLHPRQADLCTSDSVASLRYFVENGVEKWEEKVAERLASYLKECCSTARLLIATNDEERSQSWLHFSPASVVGLLGCFRFDND